MPQPRRCCTGLPLRCRPTLRRYRPSPNPASHCDIAWAGALATHAHNENKGSVGAATIDEHGNIVTGEELVAREKARKKLTPEQALLLSNDPRIWKPL